MFAKIISDADNQVAWSDPDNWAGGAVPASSNTLIVELGVNSFADVGTSLTAPFLTAIVFGVNDGAGLPSLVVGTGEFTPLGGGFLKADDILNLSSLDVGLFNHYSDPTGAGLVVTGDLVNVAAISAGLGSMVHIGGDIGVTDFTLKGSTLIIDHPEPGQFLFDQITVSRWDYLGGPPVQTTTSIELGHVVFDQADFIPSVPGSSTGQIQLTNHGALVYMLDNVSGVVSASGGSGAYFGGVDPATGYDILKVTSA
jgi:hypothetical protein